jgi:hypothetical protein
LARCASTTTSGACMPFNARLLTTATATCSVFCFALLLFQFGEARFELRQLVAGAC